EEPGSLPGPGRERRRSAVPLAAFAATFPVTFAALPHALGSPRLGVLRRLRPVPAGRPTANPARARPLAARDPADRDGSCIHCDSLDEGGAQLCPCGLATATPQIFTVASRQAAHARPESAPRNEGDGYAPLPVPIHQI